MGNYTIKYQDSFVERVWVNLVICLIVWDAGESGATQTLLGNAYTNSLHLCQSGPTKPWEGGIVARVRQHLDFHQQQRDQGKFGSTSV